MEVAAAVVPVEVAATVVIIIEGPAPADKVPLIRPHLHVGTSRCGVSQGIVPSKHSTG